MGSRELETMERLLAHLDQQLNEAIHAGSLEMARYLYGQIAGALMMAAYLEIIDYDEHDRRYLAVQNKFYDAF